MKSRHLFFVLLVGASHVMAQPLKTWPVLKHYDKDHLFNIAMPIGGIGTGTVSLGGRGELRDWAIMNKPAIGYSTVTSGNNQAPFFAIYIKDPANKPVCKALIGPVDPVEYANKEGRSVNQHGLPRFAEASFDAAYPFAQVNLSDKTLPVKVKIKGFNPLIPGDADASGIPIAVLSYEVTNTGNKTLSVSVAGSIRNFIGKDGSKISRDWKGDYIPVGAKKNKNIYRSTDIVKGIYMFSDSVDSKDPAWGTMALTTPGEPGVSYRTSSRSNDWENALLDFWDDFGSDGQLTEKDKLVDDDPMASLAVRKEIPPGQTRSYTFFITWNFPNRYAWSDFQFNKANELVGNFYSTQYQDAWDVAVKTVPRLPLLEKASLSFVNAFIKSSYPPVILEAALFNLSTLRSQTVFRIADGHMMGWEGIMDETGSCYGSCTHVWNYEQATPFLFGSLALTMRDVEFNYATDETGKMAFRVKLPLTKAQTEGAAADGQMGTILKFYRDWHLSGDNGFLEKNWPQVKKVMGYTWRKGGWDGNQDGVMEGSQHNTMDVSYFGPNPQMGFWYLGALKAAAAMAAFMHDMQFEEKCNELYGKGSAWMDKNLFNGEYYEHRITDPKTFEFLDMKDPNVKIPDYQLGNGCLVDQLVGQMMSHICGLGYLGDRAHIKTALKSIMKYNYLTSFDNHFNNMRSYVMSNEAGLLMVGWPKGRLKVPLPYFSESMTGFEYTAAAGMIYEGRENDAIKAITSIRNRFDGRKRNPFDEPECGHHYARAMSSWATVLAWSGFNYSGVTKSMSFTARPGIYFWSNSTSWGTCKIETGKATITVLHGQITLSGFTVQGRGTKKLNNFTIAQHQVKSIIFP